MKDKKLVSYKNIRAIDKVDSTGNRERMDIKATTEKYGDVEIVYVFDYGKKLYYRYIPKVDKCVINDFPWDIDLEKLYHKMKNPKSGFMEFKGVNTPEWLHDEKFFTFYIEAELNSDDDSDKPVKVKLCLHFDMETKELKWAHEHVHNIIVEVTDGFEDKEFDDETFEIKDCKNPRFDLLDSWFSD